MDQYGLAYLCLATIFVGWSICKYMIKRWGTRDHLSALSNSLNAIQRRLDSTRIEGICVCHACAAASLADPNAAIGVVESRRASVISVVINDDAKVEAGQSAT